MRAVPQYGIESNSNVIARSQTFGGGGGTVLQDIILWYDEESAAPFVTHHRELKAEDGTTGSYYFWGHYSYDMEAALIDFAERCRRQDVHVERLEGTEVRK